MTPQRRNRRRMPRAAKISILEAVRRFGDPMVPETRLRDQLWDNGERCPSRWKDGYSAKTVKNSMLAWYVCRSRVPRDREEGCGGYSFSSVNTDSVVQDSNLLLENPKGKAVVMGIKDSASNLIRTTHLPDNSGNTIKPFISVNTLLDATVYSVLHRAREVVNHSVCEYVHGVGHAKGIESFWGLLKSAYHSVFRHFSEKHMLLYADEFAGRHNLRLLETVDKIIKLVRPGIGERLPYQTLFRPRESRQPALLKAW